jgi:hypothetical protein
LRKKITPIKHSAHSATFRKPAVATVTGLRNVDGHSAKAKNIPRASQNQLLQNSLDSEERMSRTHKAALTLIRGMFSVLTECCGMQGLRASADYYGIAECRGMCGMFLTINFFQPKGIGESSGECRNAKYLNSPPINTVQFWVW